MGGKYAGVVERGRVHSLVSRFCQSNFGHLTTPPLKSEQ